MYPSLNINNPPIDKMAPVEDKEADSRVTSGAIVLVSSYEFINYSRNSEAYIVYAPMMSWNAPSNAVSKSYLRGKINIYYCNRGSTAQFSRIYDFIIHI